MKRIEGFTPKALLPESQELNRDWLIQSLNQLEKRRKLNKEFSRQLWALMNAPLWDEETEAKVKTLGQEIWDDMERWNSY